MMSVSSETIRDVVTLATTQGLAPSRFLVAAKNLAQWVGLDPLSDQHLSERPTNALWTSFDAYVSAASCVEGYAASKVALFCSQVQSQRAKHASTAPCTCAAEQAEQTGQEEAPECFPLYVTDVQITALLAIAEQTEDPRIASLYHDLYHLQSQYRAHRVVGDRREPVVGDWAERNGETRRVVHIANGTVVYRTPHRSSRGDHYRVPIEDWVQWVDGALTSYAKR